MRNRWIKWVFFAVALVFGQLANYLNPDMPLWTKLLITSISLTFSGVVMAINE